MHSEEEAITLKHSKFFRSELQRISLSDNEGFVSELYNSVSMEILKNDIKIFFFLLQGLENDTKSQLIKVVDV